MSAGNGVEMDTFLGISSRLLRRLHFALLQLVRVLTRLRCSFERLFIFSFSTRHHFISRIIIIYILQHWPLVPLQQNVVCMSSADKKKSNEKIQSIEFYDVSKHLVENLIKLSNYHIRIELIERKFLQATEY